MTRPELSRRKFSKLTVAALGGLVSGTLIGCNKAEETKTTGGATPSSGGAGDSSAGDGDTMEVAAHACRGLNDCKTAQHECRGQGTCATEAWHHACTGHNDCKGQGGCGANPIQNSCEGKGECAVPLHEGTWEKAREHMEAQWKAADKEFGEAPARPS